MGPVESLIAEALQQRPEIATARLTLTNSEITKKSLRNELKPAVDLYAFYGASALAGPRNPLVYRSHPMRQSGIPRRLRRRLQQLV